MQGNSTRQRDSSFVTPANKGQARASGNLGAVHFLIFSKQAGFHCAARIINDGIRVIDEAVKMNARRQMEMPQPQEDGEVSMFELMDKMLAEFAKLGASNSDSG